MVKVKNDLITVVTDIVNLNISKYSNLVNKKIEIWFDDSLNKKFTQPKSSITTYKRDSSDDIVVISINPYKPLKVAVRSLVHELAHVCSKDMYKHNLEWKQYVAFLNADIEAQLSNIKIGEN